jgi:hypothetical protein
LQKNLAHRHHYPPSYVTPPQTNGART